MYTYQMLVFYFYFEKNMFEKLKKNKVTVKGIETAPSWLE